MMSENNQTVNSSEEMYNLEKAAEEYNIRNEHHKIVTGEKRINYDLLERFRGMSSDELSSNYWVIQ